MLGNIIILAASVACLPFCYGATVSDEFAVRRGVQALNLVVSDESVLNAFIDAGHPDAMPSRTWEDTNGTTYQSLYMFNPDEWNGMYAKLLEDAGYNSTALASRHIVSRDSSDPPEFFCDGYRSSPKVFQYTLGSIAGAICGGINFAAEARYKTQVLSRTGLSDINNKPIKAIFKYTWKSFQWATVSSCGLAISTGINDACDSTATGVNGEGTVTQGFEEQYGAGGADLDVTMNITPA